MGYHLNRLYKPIYMAGPKPMQTEFGIHNRLESCVANMEKRLDIEVEYVASIFPLKSDGLALMHKLCRK